MSVTATKAVLRYPLQDCTFKAVLFALGDYANSNLQAWPAVATLSEHSGAGASTVRRKLKLAQDLGLIRVMHRADMSSVYTFQQSFIDKYGEPEKSEPAHFAHGAKEVNPQPMLMFDDPFCTPSRCEHTPSQSEHMEGVAPPPAASTPPPRASTPPPAAGYKPLVEPLVEPLETRSRADVCNFVFKRWNDLAAEHPRMPSCRAIDENRKSKIVKLADEFKKEGQGLIEVWEEIFQAIERSPFLLGNAEPGFNRSKAFRPEFGWFLNKENFVKVINGKYDDQRDSAGRNIAGAQKRGPTATAVDQARQRFQSFGQRAGG